MLLMSDEMMLVTAHWSSRVWGQIEPSIMIGHSQVINIPT